MNKFDAVLAMASHLSQTMPQSDRRIMAAMTVVCVLVLFLSATAQVIWS